MRRVTMAVLAACLGACQAQTSPEVLRQWQSPPRYTCCNIHYEGAAISDANYYVGALLPLGTAASVRAMSGDSVTFSAGSVELTLRQAYGTAQEPAQQYFAKVLVATDPRDRLATFSPSVQGAITDARVEVGMTKEQVLMSLGYPATHRTPSTDASTWTYWYNRWLTYTVAFGADGSVSHIAGGNAPTRNQPVTQ